MYFSNVLSEWYGNLSNSHEIKCIILKGVICLMGLIQEQNDPAAVSFKKTIR